VRSGRREAAGAFGAVLASFGLTLAVVRLSATPRPARHADAPPLRFGDSAARCETCHPRQTAEWRRSVMAHASRSPLFQALELLIEEEVGRANA
jgi:eukaryotic-like serine/threonine-protein kinase